MSDFMMNIRTLIMAINFFLTAGNSIAQCPNTSCGPNLLPNPNFEITSQACGDPSLTCIMFYDTTKVQDWWGTAPSGPGSTQPNTPDYSNPACVGSAFGCNNFGAACVGGGHVWLAEPNYEYIQAQLIAPLEADSSYCFTFTYRLGFNITGFGVWLHNFGKIFHSGQFIFNTQPPSMIFSNNSGSGCQTASMNFTASGGETWILIGPTMNSQEITLDNLSLYKTCMVTGIHDDPYDVSDEIQIYPNPGDGIFTLEIQNTNSNLHEELEVYNLLGEKVFQTPITIPKSTIDLSGLSKGMYFLKVTNAGVFGKTRSFIIN